MKREENIKQKKINKIFYLKNASWENEFQVKHFTTHTHHTIKQGNQHASLSARALFIIVIFFVFLSFSLFKNF